MRTEGVGGLRASFSTVARKSFAVKGEFWRKDGTCAHAQSGRVVVDSQSMMQVYAYEIYIRRRVYICAEDECTYDLRVVVLVDEHVLEVQIVAVDREQLLHPSAIILTTTSPIALSVRNDAQALHHPQEAGHIRLHALLALREVRNQERRPLHPPIILVHRRPRAVPLRLALLPVPLVRRVRAVVGERGDLVVP